MKTDAVISNCGQYRYVLTRRFDDMLADHPLALFLMLNPSTADADLDDPTIRRCIGFAKAWGCSGVVVVNLYALRSTDPSQLWRHEEPVGKMNDKWISRLGAESVDVICAWGANAKAERVEEVVKMLESNGARLWCLGTTKSGAPRHPLYVKADQKLIPWVDNQ